MGEGLGLDRVLDRIPEQIDTGGPAPVRLGEAGGEPLELARVLEGRIDEDEAAALRGGT